MIKSVKYVVCLVCLILIFDSCSSDAAPEELKKMYVKYIMECYKRFPLSENDLVTLKSKKVPSNKASKCMLHCIYKKSGIVDQNGYLSVNKISAITQKYLANNPHMLKKSRQFAEACAHVNDETITDKDQPECERAALIFQCTIDRAAEFEFII